MTRQAWKVAPVVFCSGLCALIYQIAWTRAFRLIFGASTAASAAVIAIFIGGLGLGGLVLGRRAEKSARPLAFYANLELGIAVSAAATPALLWLARKAYVAAGGTLSMGLAGGTIARIVLAVVVLAVPTVLMGGTLPALARAVETDADDGQRRGVALLYGINTLGAVVGCLAANFVLLEVFGTQLCLWLACLVNLLIAVIARGMARNVAPIDPAEAMAPAIEEEARAPRVFVLGAAAVVGFAFFLMELVWYRMLGPLLGGTIFTFGLILGVALFGIGIGGALYTVLLAKRRVRLAGFAWTCLLEAALIAIPFALGDRVAIFALLLRPVGALGFSGFVLGWTAVACLVILPAAIVSGVQFPMLIALLGKGRRDVGRQVGMTYAWNTVGAIAGALMGGFGLLPALTAPGCWRLVVAVLTATGVAAIILAARERRRWLSVVLPAGIGAAVVAMLFAGGPTAAWRHSPIGAGRLSPTSLSSPNAIKRFIRDKRREIAWEAEGVESSVAIDQGNGYAFVVNGKVDGHSRSDAETQVMSGLLGAILHPNPKSAMIIGLGTGSTAGWLGKVESMERVDVAELEPAIREVARRCAPVNQSVMDNPKVHVILGDAREILSVTRERYDIVFSEPSNPYRAGIASLYTEEYYQTIRDRLNDGGVFLQWVQAYEVDARTVRTIFATLASVFPSVEAWQAKDQDLILVATKKPLAHDVAALRARIAEEPYKTALRVAWRVDDLEGVLGHFLAARTLAQAIAESEGALNTDDQPLVEFGFAKSLTRETAFNTGMLLETARLRHETRPDVSGGDVDWERVQYERASLSAVENSEPRIPTNITARYKELLQIQSAYVQGNFLSAHTIWRAPQSAHKEPSTPLEQSIIAEVCTHMSDPESRRYIELLRPWNPAEADGLLAIALVHEGKLDDAAAAFEASFARYRTDPWPLGVVMFRVLHAADDLAARDPRLGLRMVKALSEPFAVHQLDNDRLNMIVTMTRRLGDAASCVDALRPFEPSFPWTLDLLRFRRDCYLKADPPRAGFAQSELDEFLLRHPFPFGSGLEP